jgi:TP901 family phage tail tape measure protein
MNIQVRVLSAQAQTQIKALEAELARLRTELAATNTASNAANAATARSVGGLKKWGSQLQWAGRQLQYNFTIPILLAAGAATKFYMDNQKALVGLKKVYGDLGMSQRTINNEVKALSKAFEALSAQYGVQQKQVIEIGAAWAQAGVSGVALAKSTELTLKTMVLGEMDSTKATQALIAIQAQYRLSTSELTDVIGQLNIIENQTGVSLADLVDGFSRTAGVARAAGVTVKELGAMMAALVPAAGTAAQAGNALKTIFSRLLSPTAEAADVLKEMGINLTDTSWKSATATQRLEIMAKQFSKLEGPQRAVVSALVASRFQLNKFEILMDSMNSKFETYYDKANKAVEQTDYMRVAQKELNQVLQSDPKRLERTWVMLQNAMADIIIPMIPAILGLANMIQRLAQAFSDLDPTIQMFIMSALLALAAVGPLARMIGATSLLFGEMSSAIKWVGANLKLLVGWIAETGLAIGRFLIGPWGLAIAAAVALIVVFRRQIEQAFTNLVNWFQHSGSAWVAVFKPVVDFFGAAVDYIEKAFNSLPNAVQNALMAVVTIVATAAKQVYEWLSYLNPFARHSPSVVDNVRAGMAVIRNEFSSIASIHGPIDKAYKDIKRFSQATAAFRGGMDTAQRAQDRKTVAKVDPGALHAFDALVADLKQLTAMMNTYEAAVKRQETVVQGWKDKLDAANAELDKQQKKLDDLQAKLDKWQKKLDDSQTALANWSQTPITGMKAMSDAIFSNEQAQKKLRLEMMNMEDAVGPIDDLRARYAALQGDIENLKGEQANLRSAGAGSDILATYDQQIAGLQAQQQATQDATKPIDDLQKQLDALQREGERLDLTNSLQFDPLTRQIEAASNAMQEMPFDVIMAGIQQAQTDIGKYQDKVDAATKAVNDQTVAVNNAQAARDKVSANLDREQKQLDGLQQKYQDVKSAVDDVTTALNDMVSASNDSIRAAKAKASAKGSVSPGLQNFRDAAGGKFADVGGSGGLGREGSQADQSKLIDQFTEDLRKRTGQMFGNVDFTGPFRRAWKNVTDWWTANITPALSALGGEVEQAWGKISFDGPLAKITAFGHAFWDLFGGDIMKVVNVLSDNLHKAIVTIGPELEAFKGLIKPLGDLFVMLWNGIKPVAEILGLALLANLKLVADVFANTLGPVLDTAIDLIADVLKAFRGVIEFVVGVMTGDWALAWKGIQDTFMGTWEGIYHILEGAVSIVVGFIKGIVEGVVGWFKWLYDTLIGHSIIPDIINGIFDWFHKLADLPGWIYDHTLKPIFEGMRDWWTNTLKPKVDDISSGIIGFFHKLGDLPQWLWDNTWNALWTKLSNFWDNTLLPGVQGIKQGIVDQFHALGNLPEWLYNNSFLPIWTKLKDVWDNYLVPLGNRILRGFGNIFNGVGEAVAAGVNIAIGAINKLIDGLDWIGSHVPGLSFKVSNIGTYSFEKWSPPQYAKGGILPTAVGGGFMTNGARAIVGEGGPHPEFVIPTDPRHRKNATDLLGKAAEKLGVGGIGDVWDSMKTAGSKATSFLRENAVNAIFAPINAAVNALLTQVPSELGLRAFAKYGVQQIQDFASGVNDHLVTSGPWGKPVALALGLPFGNTYSDGSFHSGQDFPGPIGTAIKAASAGIVKASYDIHGTSPYNNFPYASYGRLVQINHGDGIETLYAHLSERLVEAGDKIKTGDLIGRLGEMGNATGPHLHFEVRRNGDPINPIPFLADKGVRYDGGGWLPHGGVGVNTSGMPEPVFSNQQWSTIDRATRVSMAMATTLPNTIKDAVNVAVDRAVTAAVQRATVVSGANGTTASTQAGGVTINIYGNLEMPNITDGTDAEQFLKNLESLAG